jgi:HopA1 effector protein family
LSLPFVFKAVCDPTDCDRYTTGILAISKDSYEAVRPILQQLYQVQQSQFRTRAPLFTKLLAPGLSLSEEPSEPGMFCKISERFGKNRCQIVAGALLEAHYLGFDSSQDRMSAILQSLLAQGVNLHSPYLNSNSNDIYSELMS